MVVFLRSHLTIDQFMDELMKEWTFVETQIDHLESGGDKKDLKKTMNSADVVRMERIKRVVERARTYDSPIDYLHAIAAATKKIK